MVEGKLLEPHCVALSIKYDSQCQDHKAHTILHITLPHLLLFYIMNLAIVKNEDAVGCWIRIHDLKEPCQPFNKFLAIVQPLVSGGLCN